MIVPMSQWYMSPFFSPSVALLAVALAALSSLWRKYNWQRRLLSMTRKSNLFAPGLHVEDQIGKDEE